MCRFTDFVEIQYREFRLIISYTMYVFIEDFFFLFSLYSTLHISSVVTAINQSTPVRNDNETWNVTNVQQERKKAHDTMKFPFKSTLKSMSFSLSPSLYVLVRKKKKDGKNTKRSYHIRIDKSSNNFSIWLESCLFNPFDGFVVSFQRRTFFAEAFANVVFMSTGIYIGVDRLSQHISNFR